MGRSRASKNLDRWVRRHQFKHLCQCGCGEYIVVRREHHKKSVGIPKFVPGHNLQAKKETLDEQESLPEKPSLWERLSPEEQERRLGLLKSFGKGEENPAWKGGRRVDENGYVQILIPEHPFAKDGYVAEHRLLVEERTRIHTPWSPLLIELSGEKYLAPDTVVHHIDEDKTNNDPGTGPDDIGNLMLLPCQAAHAFIHKSNLPMEEKLRRIALGIYHGGPLAEDEEA